ncbi:MAG: hypothetical protein KatS3mg032_0928 [Cyclobacteriaceae bacterium]|nr:MAG: hypothetical protein KatS3mg032_0928 [Cyclobacteriaceae bacterium]
MKNDLIIRFFISGISIRQFALFEDVYKQDEPYEVRAEFRFSINKNDRIISLGNTFSFYQKDVLVLIIEVTHNFSIDQKSWNDLRKPDNRIQIPKNFLTHLMMIATGTSRGILYAKTQRTKLSNLILQPFNVSSFIKDDFIEA